jgi:hypothetical protein
MAGLEGWIPEPKLIKLTQDLTTPMKNAVQLKKPLGKVTFSRVRNARYVGWEDAFDVEFKDGLCFLQPHATIRKTNRISAKAVPVNVEVDNDSDSHFKVICDTGEVAKVSWDFIRELPPQKRGY